MSEFSLRHLSVMHYANGFTEWHFRAYNFTRAQLLIAKFFDQAADMFKVGDKIVCTLTNGHVELIVTATGFKEAVSVAILHEVFWS
jgi:hypothetical protein